MTAQPDGVRGREHLVARASAWILSAAGLMLVLSIDVAHAGLLPSYDSHLIGGIGGGFGLPYGGLGCKANLGTDLLMAEVGVGTVAFVWRSAFSAGASLNLLDRSSWIRPKLLVMWTTNASAITVFEPEQEGKVSGAVEYEAFAGMIYLAGFDVRPTTDIPGTIELGAGWRIPFKGMNEVNRRASDYVARYPYDYDVATPRWDQFSIYLGFNYSPRRVE